MSTILIVPGLHDSGAGHWQTLWEAQLPGAARVQQANWDQPDFTAWTSTLAQAILARQGNVVVVAHSLGCIALAHAAAAGVWPRAALLVAPADVDRPGRPAAVAAFAPVPLRRLPFASIVVASANDPHVAAPRAASFARAWGSQLIEIGEAGHISVADGFGAWPEGLALLARLNVAAAA